jgi:hypothetical protein
MKLKKAGEPKVFCSYSLANVQAVIQRTIADFAAAGIPSRTKRGQLELRLVQSQHELVDPVVKLHAESVPSKTDDH